MNAASGRDETPGAAPGAGEPAESDATSLHALAPPRRPNGLLSLFLTGMADVWSAARTGVAKRGDLGGLLYMVASAFSFALMAACVKLFLPTVPTGRTVFWRGTVMALAFFLIARLRGVSVRGTRHGKLVLRGLLGAGAVSCYFWSVQHLSIGDAVLIQYSHPVFVAVMAPLFLGEKTGRGHWLWVSAAFAGMWVVVRYGVGGAAGGGGASDAIVGLCGSLLSGFAYMTVRDLSRTENAWTILVWFSATMAPVAAVHAFVDGVTLVPVDVREALGHLAMTAAGLVGQFALTQGLSRAGAARATAVSMSGPVFGLLLDLAFFGVAPSVGSFTGTAIVVAALTLLAINRPRT
jgi:drug/metabolite transporter (DMT)-like permease